MASVRYNTWDYPPSTCHTRKMSLIASGLDEGYYN